MAIRCERAEREDQQDGERGAQDRLGPDAGPGHDGDAGGGGPEEQQLLLDWHHCSSCSGSL